MIQEGSFIADRYEVIARIGAGGMSDVYKAKDHVLGRNVAIKVLKQEFSEDANFLSKFRAEAQSAAGLEHPNIVNIYDVGSESGIYYIVMEYIAGMTLKTYIEKKGQLNYKETISIAIQVGRGIEAAHKNKIVHRDIKPQNIMISNDGKVKVTDFGIARAASNNTIHSDVMGSVHYTSPEQARNGFVDYKSDIYSLGIVMYEMVTGRVPYDGDTAVAVAIQHLQDEMVPPSRYAQDLPMSLEKIIMKCTQKSPDRRYQDMESVLVDLKRVLINPNEDFVTIVDNVDTGKTRVMGEDEIRQIQEQTVNPVPRQPVAPSVIPITEEEEEEPVQKKAPKKKPQKKVIFEPVEEPDEDEEDDEEDEEEGMNPKMEKMVTILGIVAAVVIVFIIVYLLGNFFGLFHFGKKAAAETEATEAVVTEVKSSEDVDDGKITMIDVSGMTVDAARTALNELGLGIREEGEQSSDQFAAGQIISQDIYAGQRVEKNTTVHVIVSNGAGTISIPDVRKLSYEDATSILKQSGFDVARTEDYSEDIPEGKVISTTPDSNSSAKKGDIITVTVSIGAAPPTEFTMPNYSGQDQDPVVAELKSKYQCTVTINLENNDTYAAGKVIATSPTPGATVRIGGEVLVAVSKGSANQPAQTQETAAAEPQGAVSVQSQTYTYSTFVKVPENGSVTGASYRLEDANHNVVVPDTAVTEFTAGDDGARRFKVSGSNITTPTGYLYVTWTLSDGSVRDNATYPMEVTFKAGA